MEIVIPIKSTSQRLPNKNLLPSHRGLPLYAETITAAREAFPNSRINVYIDDLQLAPQIESLGAKPQKRTVESTRISIDEFAQTCRGEEDMLLLQPDQQGPQMVEAMKYFTDAASLNQQYSSVAVVVDSGLIYRDDGSPMQPRSESPTFWRERGWRFYPKEASATAFSPVRLPYVLHDINTYTDYQTYLNSVRKKQPKIRIVYLEQSRLYGSGHERRAKQIEAAITPFASIVEMVPVQKPGEIVSGFADITIIDTLDTTVRQVLVALRHSKRVVTFEDQGPGSTYAHATINALYGTPAPNRYTGAEYALIRPEFLLCRLQQNRSDRSGVLVTFGGTDLNHLSERVVDILSSEVPELSVVPPPGRKLVRLGQAHRVTSNIAQALAHAEVVVTSGGRTLLEAAAVGTPAVVLAQNAREATHTHLGPSHGNVFLGYGAQVTADMLVSTVNELRSPSTGYWDDLHAAALRSVDGGGWWRVLSIILGRSL